MVKTNKKNRIEQARNLINLIPKGRKSAYKKPILYKLAEQGIIIDEVHLHSFFQTGYSKHGDKIMQTLKSVVDEMIREEETYQANISNHVA